LNDAVVRVLSVYMA